MNKRITISEKRVKITDGYGMCKFRPGPNTPSVGDELVWQGCIVRVHQLESDKKSLNAFFTVIGRR